MAGEGRTDAASQDSVIEARRDVAAGRFEIVVDDVLAGFADYRDFDGVREFPHTVVDPAFGGRGLAWILVGHALDETGEEGLRVRPTCSFVARYIEKNPAYATLLE